MLDWQNFIFSCLWVTALAACLAVVSWNIFQVFEKRKSLPAALSAGKTPLLLKISGALFCIGLAGSSASSAGEVWRVILWVVLAAAFLGLIFVK